MAQKVLFSDSAYLITFCQVLWNLITFLINTINRTCKIFRIRICIQHFIKFSLVTENKKMDKQSGNNRDLVIKFLLISCSNPLRTNLLLYTQSHFSVWLMNWKPSSHTCLYVVTYVLFTPFQ